MERIQATAAAASESSNSYLNRFYDTPFAKIRMSRLVFYKLRAQGFLHWGYNYWYVCKPPASPRAIRCWGISRPMSTTPKTRSGSTTYYGES